MLEKFAAFQEYHNSFPNLVFHFLSSVLQIAFAITFVIEWNPIYIVCLAVVPFITDAVGHLLEGNFSEVMEKNSEAKALNVADANPFLNFLFKLIALPIAIISREPKT